MLPAWKGPWWCRREAGFMKGQGGVTVDTQAGAPSAPGGEAPTEKPQRSGQRPTAWREGDGRGAAKACPSRTSGGGALEPASKDGSCGRERGCSRPPPGLGPPSIPTGHCRASPSTEAASWLPHGQGVAHQAWCCRPSVTTTSGCFLFCLCLLFESVSCALWTQARQLRTW